jgi:UDP-GlcNAc:undecaprenyl-phosphate GlcNAc-1-phosphate transferase
MKVIWAGIFSFLAVFLTTPVFRALAVKLDIVDLPNRRSIHKRAMPLLGGVAIYFGISAGLLLHLKELQFFFPILLGATIILIVGLIDDIWGLSAQSRIIAQLSVAAIIMIFGIRISFLPDTIWGNIGEIAVTILWILGVTNAYNYLDGMDGLAVGSAAINSFCFALILYSTGQFSQGLLAVILSASCVGFLPYNFKKAKMFLGDAGSTLLGFVLASISLIGNWAEDNMVKISIPILILGVPIFDMIFTTIMRIKDKKVKTVVEWLKYAGKDHFHHCLVDLGLNTEGAVTFIYFITLSLGISAIMVSNDSAVEGLLTLSQASIIFGVIATLIVVGKRRRSGWN